MYTLRNYQREAVDAAIKCFKSKKNGILVEPTGSGKSIIIAKVIEEVGGKNLLLQPTKEILEQNLEKLQAVGCKGLGVYSASMGSKRVGAITLATIGSITKKSHLFEGFDRVFIDEAHKVNPKEGMYKKLDDELNLPTVGLTATPYRLKSYNDFRTDMRVSESRILTRVRPRIFSKIVHITQIQELFEAGYLCPLDYHNLNNYDSCEIKPTTTMQGFNPESLARYNKKMSITDKMIIKVEDSKQKHILCFTEFTSESLKVVEGLTAQGISCVEISAETKKQDRERILRQFKSGKIRCVVNVGVLTTGFDFPELDHIILGRPTRSVALYYQMLGRGIRISDGKDSCVLDDLCDNVKRFGKIETFELFDQNGKGMWRLKSSAGNLTGVNVITGKNLEKSTVKAAPVLNEAGEECITFGKHNGIPLSKVPEDYLTWCAENIPNPKVKAVCKKELRRRENL